MNETTMRRQVINALVELDAISVENPCRPGTPDVNYVYGWIELKYLKNWPKRGTTKVACKQFTPQQRVWLRRRRRAGGLAFLLLRVEATWMLFDGAEAAALLGASTRRGLMDSALCTWEGKFTLDRVKEFLVPERSCGSL